MKKISFSLAFALFFSSTALPIDGKEAVKILESKYAQFKTAMHDYWKCLKGDKSCDPAKIKKVRIATGTLLAAVGLITIYNINKFLSPSTEEIKKIILSRLPEKSEINVEEFIDDRKKISFWEIITNDKLENKDIKKYIKIINSNRSSSPQKIKFRTFDLSKEANYTWEPSQNGPHRVPGMPSNEQH